MSIFDFVVDNVKKLKTKNPITDSIEGLDDIIKIQTTDPANKTDEYMRGLSNGLLVAKATVTDDEGDLKLINKDGELDEAEAEADKDIKARITNVKSNRWGQKHVFLNGKKYLLNKFKGEFDATIETPKNKVPRATIKAAESLDEYAYPLSPNIMMFLATHWEDLKSDEEAIDALETNFDLAPDTASAHLEIAKEEFGEVGKELAPAMAEKYNWVNEETWYHGSASGDLRGGATGLHLGTRKAASDALNARIGYPAEGEWDGTREYGKTKLAGQKTMKRRGLSATGFNAGRQDLDIPEEDYYASDLPKEYLKKQLAYPDGTMMPMTNKPSIRAYQITGKMSNTPATPHGDWQANARMASLLKRGKARRGYFYKNVGEDEGSISAVVPSGSHVKPVGESTIDFPEEDLTPEIWTKTEAGYELNDEAKDLIVDTLNSNPIMPDVIANAEDIRIIGSICTNLYQSDTDVDVHISLKPEVQKSIKDIDEFQKQVIKWSREKSVLIGTHPIEVFIQPNSAQDMMSDGVYSITKSEWLKGPAILDAEYNPYEVFKDAFIKIQDFAKEADVDLGELKRDVIDYEAIDGAYRKLPETSKEKLKMFLNSKLEEIEDDINDLLKDKKEWIEYRRSTKATTDPEQAMKDIEIVKQWHDVNATFKMLNRYGYIKLITELEKIKDVDTEIKHEDVPKVAKVIDAKPVDEDANPETAHVKGQKFQVGDKVKVVSLTDAEADETLLGKTGTIISYDYECGSGQSREQCDPMYYIDFGIKKEEFWGEELQLSESIDEGAKCDYSNTQIEVPHELAEKIIEFGLSIPEEDIYTDPNDPSYGRELIPHITIKWGLVTEDPNEVESLIEDDSRPIDVTLGKISVFSKDDKPYDVVKVDVESEELNILHDRFSSLENNDENPDYNPHMTIAYVKKGMGDKYIGRTDFEGEQFVVDRFEFKDQHGNSKQLILNQT